MPDRPTTRRLRALRGTAAAAIATTLASTGHTIGGGTPPPLWLLLAVTVLAAPLAVALVGGRRSFVRLAAAIAAAQIALHAAFAAVGSLSPIGGAHEHLAMPMPMPMPMLASGGAPHATSHLSPAMLCGHILAGLITIALVAYGEQLLVGLARGIRRLLTRPQATALMVHPRVPVLSPAPLLAHAARFLTALTRRGPPAFAR